MKNLIIKVIFSFLLLNLLSCDKELKIKVKDADKNVVVNSTFNNLEPFKVSVTESFLPNQSDNIKDLSSATVKLYENDVFIEQLAYSKSPKDAIGYFYANVIPSEQETYKIEVEVPNFEMVSATDSMPANTPITDASVAWKLWGTDTIDVIRYNFDLTINDPSPTNYYYITMSCPVYRLNKTTNQYDFYTQQYAEILTTDLPEHEKYLNNALLFNDEQFNGSNKRILGTATMYRHPCCYSDVDVEDLIIDKSKLNIKLNSLSKESWNFHSSYAKRLAAAYDVYSEPVTIYSNINNGLGIFAGENITEMNVEIVY